MKKLSFILAMILLFAACGAPAETVVEDTRTDVEISVERALYEYHRDMYEELDCDGVGFIIMGDTQVGDYVDIYTICSYGAYEEKDDAMCKTQGHACIPMVVTLEKESLEPVEVKEPEDSERYFESAQELFPDKYHERIFNLSIDDFTAVTSMETDAISKYLEENDMEMQIKY